MAGKAILSNNEDKMLSLRQRCKINVFRCQLVSTSSLSRLQGRMADI